MSAKICNTSLPSEPASRSSTSKFKPSSPPLKPVPTAVANVLPPCRVCGAKASGFHYGVNTCEACKGFFRRSLRRENDYVCRRSGKCWDTDGKLRKCAACRYNACIDVGMSKNAIKTGRYTNMKKTMNTLEVKILETESKKPSQAPEPESESGTILLESDSVTSTTGTDLSTGCETVSGIQTELDIVLGSEMEPDSGTLSESCIVPESDTVDGLDIITDCDVVSDFNMVGKTNMTPGFEIVPASENAVGLDKMTDCDIMSEFNVGPNTIPTSQIVPGSDIVDRLELIACSDVEDRIDSEYETISGCDMELSLTHNTPEGSTSSDSVGLSDIETESFNLSGSIAEALSVIVRGIYTVPGSDIETSPDTASASDTRAGSEDDALTDMMTGSDSQVTSDIVPGPLKVPESKSDELLGSDTMPGSYTEALSYTDLSEMTQKHDIETSCYGSDMEALTELIPGPFVTKCNNTNAFPDMVPSSNTEVVSVMGRGHAIEILSAMELDSNTEAISCTVPNRSEMTASHTQPLCDTIPGTDSMTGSDFEDLSDISPMPLVPESESESDNIMDTVPVSSIITGSNIEDLSDIEVSDMVLGTYILSDMVMKSEMNQPFDIVPDTQNESVIPSACDLMHTNVTMPLVDMVTNVRLMPGSAISTHEVPSHDVNSLGISGGLKPKWQLDTEVTIKSDTMPCSQLPESDMMPVSNLVPDSVMMPSLAMSSYSHNRSSMLCGSTNPTNQKQDVTSLTVRLIRAEPFDWQLIPSLIRPESPPQQNGDVLILSPKAAPSPDSAFALESMYSPVRNFVLEITTTADYSLRWPNEVNDFDPVVSYLVKQHRKMLPSNIDVPRDHLLQEQIRHAEDFRLREEMFGSLTPLPLDDYLEILEKTGIEIDDRHQMAKHLIPLLDISTKEYIKFATLIPGFSDLCIEDQTNLIKVSDFEFWFIGNFPGYNSDLKIVRLPEIGCFHVKEISKLMAEEFWSETFRLAETFKKLPLLKDEFVLVRCLTMFATDRCHLKDRKKVEAIQWKIVECLGHMLRKNHPTEHNLLARIILRLTELRSLTQRSQNHNKKNAVWPILYQYPVIFDIFAASYTWQ